MADLGLTECCGNHNLRFEIWFRRRKARDTFVLQASDLATKKAWTADISRLLWRQAVHNKGGSIPCTLHTPCLHSSHGRPQFLETHRELGGGPGTIASAGARVPHGHGLSLSLTLDAGLTSLSIRGPISKRKFYLLLTTRREASTSEAQVACLLGLGGQGELKGVGVRWA